ncbi:MAG: hypothetical protein ACK5OX_04085 [Desertimonas sp.]
MLVGRSPAGERERTALGLAFFSTSGLVTLAHFTEVSPGDLDAFQLVGIVADFLQGAAALGAAAWVAWFAPATASEPVTAAAGHGGSRVG